MAQPEDQRPSLTLEIFGNLSTFSHSFEFLTLCVGLYYCLAGMYFSRISQISIFCFLICSILFRYKKRTYFVLKPIDTIVRKIIPKKYLEVFPEDDDNLVGLAAISLILTFLSLFLISWAHLISYAFILYFTIVTLEPVFSANFKTYPYVLCLIFSSLITWILSFLQDFIIQTIIGLIICFIGVSIIMIYLSKKIKIFNSFEGFYLSLVNLDIRMFLNPFLYVVVGSTVLLSFLQKKM